ncbi:MAG: SDR family NAD(P)-dependent oxidoreductase [Caldilineaceae bacterium]|nr:SDR family NAD(P)-dependent oxidoreductase [Caldilineaceae bacterium]
MRRAMITGAADGIGRALAEYCAGAGYSILGVDVDAARSAVTGRDLQAQGAQIRFLQADLGDAPALDLLVAQLAEEAPVDLLIHNAGINAVGRFETLPMERQRAVMAVNFTAPMIITAGMLAFERIRPGGTVVFISSLSHFVGYPGAAVYAATKDGLAAYGRSLRVALAPQRIHVLVVFPGPTRTAHARRYSPDNSREDKRMPPTELAGQILRAVERRQWTLIPGWGNRLFAIAGRIAPRLMEQAMRKIIYEKLRGG